MPEILINGVTREMTAEELAEWNRIAEEMAKETPNDSAVEVETDGTGI